MLKTPPSRRRTSSHLIVIGVLFVSLLTPVAFAAPASAQGTNPDVDRLYCAYFLREPDASGQAYWNDLFRGGYSLENIAEQFALSAEFRNTYGGNISTDEFVRLIYRNLFDRVPDEGGLEYWTGILDRGDSSRGVVMTYFSLGEEFINRVNALGCGATGGGSGGGGSDSGGNGGGSTDPAVADRLGSMLAWETPVKESSDDRSLTVNTSAPYVDGGQRVATTCRPAGLPTISRTFTEFPAYAFDGPTSPGLIVEGAGITAGDLRVVPLDRAPITLVSSLDSENNVQRVTDPTTSSVQTAVTTLKRDGDARLTGLDVVPSDITYVRDEVHSFEEASLEAGVSLHYEGESKSAGFSLDRSQNDAVERHTIVVRFVQPMFTIEMERDNIVDPADFFASNVTEADVDRIRNQGRIGENNPPVLIDSVTYGRIMMFTMTSESATSASELEVAVNGAYGGISGSADLTTRQRSLLQTATYGMLSYGGDQSLALSAIKDGDLSSFFGPANTTTAAPLTMSLRTLDGSSIDVGDRATLQKISCSDQDAPYQFRVGVPELYQADIDVRVNNRLFASAEWGETISQTIPQSMLRSGQNTITFEVHDGHCLLIGLEAVTVEVFQRSSSDVIWGAPTWSDRANTTICYTTWTVHVNTTTGRVTNVT